MYRIFGGFAAFLTLTTTLLVLPVHAAPLPEAEPVETTVDEVALGSVVEPVNGAVVVMDGAVQPNGVEAQDVVVSGDELSGGPALTMSRPETDEFSAVGITWGQDPALADVVSQIRVKHEDGGWGAWTALGADDIEQSADAQPSTPEVRGGTAPIWTGPGYGIEAIVQSSGGSVPVDVRLALLDPGSSEADALPHAGGPQDQPQAAVAKPRVHTRAEWGANESIMKWRPQYAPTIKAATVHHTVDSNNYTAAQVPAIMRSIYTYHAKTRGWGDIGYHLIVDKFGRIFEGRAGGLDSTVIGAHAGGFNTSTFGVSMLGNYDITGVPQPTIDAVSAIIAWKLSLFRVDPNGSTVLTSAGGGTSKHAAGKQVRLPTIFGHRDVGRTACPGRYGYEKLPAIRAGVVARSGSAAG